MAFQEGEGRVQGPETKGPGAAGARSRPPAWARGGAGTGGGRGAQQPGRETTARTSLEDGGNRLRGDDTWPPVWTPAGRRTEHRAGTWRAEGPSRGLSGVRRGPERRRRRGRGGRPRSRRRGAGSSAPPVAKPAETPPPSAGSPPRSANRARNAAGAHLARGRSAAASLSALGGPGGPSADGPLPRRPRHGKAASPRSRSVSPRTARLLAGSPAAVGVSRVPTSSPSVPGLQRRGAVWSDGTPELPWHFSQPYVAL